LAERPPRVVRRPRRLDRLLLSRGRQRAPRPARRRRRDRLRAREDAAWPDLSRARSRGRWRPCRGHSDRAVPRRRAPDDPAEHCRSPLDPGRRDDAPPVCR
jgi:hypothetical protein